MPITTAQQKRVEQKDALLLFLESSETNWAKAGRKVLALIQEERITMQTYVAMKDKHRDKLLSRGFWAVLEAAGYSIIIVEGGVTVSW